MACEIDLIYGIQTKVFFFFCKPFQNLTFRVELDNYFERNFFFIQYGLLF